MRRDMSTGIARCPETSCELPDETRGVAAAGSAGHRNTKVCGALYRT